MGRARDRAEDMERARVKKKKGGRGCYGGASRASGVNLQCLEGVGGCRTWKLGKLRMTAVPARGVAPPALDVGLNAYRGTSLD